MEYYTNEKKTINIPSFMLHSAKEKEKRNRPEWKMVLSFWKTTRFKKIIRLFLQTVKLFLLLSNLGNVFIFS